jgi:hypothetical protein
MQPPAVIPHEPSEIEPEPGRSDEVLFPSCFVKSRADPVEIPQNRRTANSSLVGQGSHGRMKAPPPFRSLSLHPHNGQCRRYAGTGDAGEQVAVETCAGKTTFQSTNGLSHIGFLNALALAQLAKTLLRQSCNGPSGLAAR